MSSRCLSTLLFVLSSKVLAQSQGVVGDYVVTEVKPFGDGNRIEHTTVGDFAYDDFGRSYLRVNEALFISDPVESVYWQVDVPNGVAYRQELVGQSLMSSEVDRFVEGDGPELLGMDWPEFGGQDVSVVELGSRTHEGVESTGRRWTHTIPAGAIGNADPIPVEAEMWLSNEFGFCDSGRDRHPGRPERRA